MARINDKFDEMLELLAAANIHCVNRKFDILNNALKYVRGLQAENAALRAGAGLPGQHVAGSAASGSESGSTYGPPSVARPPSMLQPAGMPMHPQHGYMMPGMNHAAAVAAARSTASSSSSSSSLATAPSSIDYSAVFEHAPAAMAIASLNGQFLAGNRAFRSLFSFSQAELTAKSFLSLTAQEDIASTYQAISALLSWPASSPEPPRHRFFKRCQGGLCTLNVDVTMTLLRHPSTAAPLHLLCHVTPVQSPDPNQKFTPCSMGPAQTPATAASAPSGADRSSTPGTLPDLPAPAAVAPAAVAADPHARAQPGSAGSEQRSVHGSWASGGRQDSVPVTGTPMPANPAVYQSMSGAASQHSSVSGSNTIASSGALGLLQMHQPMLNQGPPSTIADPMFGIGNFSSVSYGARSVDRGFSFGGAEPGGAAGPTRL